MAVRDSSNLLYLFCIDQAGALWTIVVAMAPKQQANPYLLSRNIVQPYPLLVSLVLLPEVRMGILDGTDDLVDTAYFKSMVDASINWAVPALHSAGNR